MVSWGLHHPLLLKDLRTMRLTIMIHKCTLTFGMNTWPVELTSQSSRSKSSADTLSWFSATMETWETMLTLITAIAWASKETQDLMATMAMATVMDRAEEIVRNWTPPCKHIKLFLYNGMTKDKAGTSSLIMFNLAMNMLTPLSISTHILIQVTMAFAFQVLFMLD